MRIGERGQVTIPKEIREQFGLGPETEVEFHVIGSSIVLKKAPKKLDLARWKGRAAIPLQSWAIPPSTSSLKPCAVDDHSN